MDTTLTIMSIWVLAWSGIQLGTLWIMKLSILPLLNALPYGRYVNTCQLIDMHVFHPIAVWGGVVAGAVGMVAAFVTSSGVAAALFVIGSLGMLGVGLTSEGVNRPIWRQIEKWPVDTVQDEKWAAKRHVWHIAHQVRTYFAVVAVAAYIGAVLAA
ncbi:hypothetical protein [Actinophytocola sp.]|uniref:hypothetical protein n=1 Tax=Actinophytocola sp. TaxID=1872138 RepID=UPI003D6A62CF